ncbi:heparinase II/III family protein [Pleomorphovibrio marinus]|uniref:heparinase II/III family protein n=1 Tax=Pleomorphovibrio marinus TaxID=2164132 RepID=UPI000E09F26B|nr:heparinase II/III family protein [Pleomorphovibrio marinus]
MIHLQLSLVLGWFLIGVCAAQSTVWTPKAFVHPGMMQNQQDLDFLKNQIKDGNPEYLKAFETLSEEADLSFEAKPFTHVVRGSYGREGQGHRELSQSARSAYAHALMWFITEKQPHADKAIEILKAWSETLWDFDDNDAKLITALTGQNFLNAAEILRYSGAGWKEVDIAQFEKLMLGSFYPVIRDFFTEANGNWDAAIINTLLCLGVFTDRQDIFESAVNRYYWGPNNGGITKYIYPNGQTQETTRDWPHVQLGLGEFAKASQVAWTQGLDFFGVAQNRLALGFEHSAKYMAGKEVPCYGPISERGRGEWRDIYEYVYDHYTEVKGLSLPHTAHAISQTREQSGLVFLSSRRAPYRTPHSDSTSPSEPLSKAMPQRGAGSKSFDSLGQSEAIRVRPGGNVQTAIDRGATEGMPVILEKGVHELSAPLWLSSGITLAGEGEETVITLKKDLSALTIGNQSFPLENITIRDLLIEGATQVLPGSDPNQGRRERARMSAPRREGIVLMGDDEGQIKGVKLINLTVQNFTKHGVSIRGAEDVHIQNCNFSDNGGNVVPGEGLLHNLHLTRVKNVSIQQSRMAVSPWGAGIWISFSQNIDIQDNVTSKNKRNGIYLTECEEVRIKDNLVEGNDTHGIFLEKLHRGNKEIEVVNNLLQTNGGKGIHTDMPEDLAMAPNIILDNRLAQAHRNSLDNDALFQEIKGHLDLDHPELVRVKMAGENHILAARELLSYYRNREGVRHLVELQKDKLSPGEKDLERAEDALQHIMVGQPAYPSYNVGRNIDWASRPVPDNEWVWQLNRMTFWEAMGKAYSQEKEEKYAHAWAYQLKDWVAKNPRDEEHKHAWRSIETGIRGYRWTGLFEYFKNSQHLTPEVLTHFLYSCLDHASFLMETYNTGSNWALMEAEGLGFIAMTFPEFSSSVSWLEESTSRFNHEITHQVYPDGHQRELAFGYHTSSIGWFLRTYEMALANGMENKFSPEYPNLIEKMCEVPMKLAFPDGTTPQFGDAWTGKPGQYYEQLRKWGDLFDRPDFLYVATEGAKGKRPEQTAFAFKHSGLYSMRSSWSTDAICMVLKCGPDGGGHSQPDNGTFELYAGGRNLTPDSGSFIYSGDPEGRAWFRQTKVHQTLTLNEQNSAYAPELLLWEPGENLDILVVENQSYPDLAHRRAVLFVDKSFFVIVDEAIGKGEGVLDLNFQLAPGNAVFDKETLSVHTDFENGYNLLVNTQLQPEIALVEQEGQVSFIYTQKEPRPAFSFQTEKRRTQKGFRYVTVLLPFQGEMPQASAKLVGKPKIGSKKISLEISVNGETKTLVYKIP